MLSSDIEKANSNSAQPSVCSNFLLNPPNMTLITIAEHELVTVELHPVAVYGMRV